MNAKHYILKITFFLIPILVCVIVLEAFLSYIPNDYLFKRKYLDKNSSEIETIIFGTSHTFSSIMPVYLDGHAFNAAIGNQSIEYDYKIFNKYKNNFKNLKTIILAVSYPTLWYRIKDNEIGLTLSFNYSKYYNLENNSSRFDLFNLAVFNRPLQINYNLIREYYINKSPVMTSDKYGWGEKFKSRPNFKTSGFRQARRHSVRDINSEENQEVIKESIRMIDEIIEWGKINDVFIVLLTTPTHYEYRKYLNDEQLEVTMNTASEIANTYDNCFYINMFEDDRFTDLDFIDTHHLSTSGAIKFSKILNLKIKEFY